MGKFIAIGAENIVYRYGNNQVIKFPTFYSLRYLWGAEKYCVELQKGFGLLKQHIIDNLNDSALYFYKNKGKDSYVIIESFVHGSAIQKNDLASEDIKSQFLEILKIKSELEKTGLFVDLFGLWGLIFSGRKKIPNLLLDKTRQKIFLVDIGTARLDDQRLLIRLVVKWAQRKQNHLLSFYLKN